jgi:hypothetical protein
VKLEAEENWGKHKASSHKKCPRPPQRPLRQSLLWSAVVIAVTALAAVVLWAITGWLWLVVHEGLH